MAGLRRLSRLRPILIILEDVHLFVQDAANEFAQLQNDPATLTIQRLSTILL
ncbi:MAG: hypothetical protein J4G05_07245 [Chlorobi bacterium]|nr:hypothetical protein [Chlorobiota bacterium]